MGFYVDRGAAQFAFIKLRLGLIKLRFVFVKLTFVLLIPVFSCRIVA